MPRHPDFERIYRAFMKRYCGSPDKECEKGKQVYYAWLNKLGLDDTKPYRIPQEKFQWAKSIFNLIKQDEKAKYYKVEALFPIVSMNRNVYTEEELIRAARTLIGKPVNLNHESHTLKGVQIIDAEYEDGAVEVLLRVLKTAGRGLGVNICDMIDKGEIVHVSIEAACRSRPLQKIDGEVGFGCEGLVFTGLALLTKDTLPGVPLTRIEPVERIIENFKLTIQGEENMSEKEKENKEKIEETEKEAETAEAPKEEVQPQTEVYSIVEPQTTTDASNDPTVTVETIDTIDTTISITEPTTTDSLRATPSDMFWKEKVEQPNEREWDTAFINSLPDAAFAVIEPAYKRGETKDKRARHLPHHGPDVKDPNEHSTVDLPHLRNALARMNQIKPITDSISTEELRRRARTHLLRHAKALLKTYQEQFTEKETVEIILNLIEELENQIAEVSIMIKEKTEETEREKPKSSENAEQESKEDSVKEPQEKSEDVIQREEENEREEQTEESEEKVSETENDGNDEIEEQRQPEEPCKPYILTKEGFWQRFRELRKEGLSQREAYRLVAMEVLKALAENKSE